MGAIYETVGVSLIRGVLRTPGNQKYSRIPHNGVPHYPTVVWHIKFQEKFHYLNSVSHVKPIRMTFYCFRYIYSAEGQLNITHGGNHVAFLDSRPRILK